MPIPEMIVRQSQGLCTLTFKHRGNLSDAELEGLLLQVFRAVNPEADLPAFGATAESLALYNEGPVLFQESAITPDAGSTTRLGGLMVVESRLSSTVTKLREVGIEVRP